MEFEEQLELIKEYVSETNEFLDEFEDSILKLEQMIGYEPNEELLTEILGALHTFKGNSGMMGFTFLQRFAHKLEDIFKALQKRNIELDSAFIELCLRCANVIRDTLTDISSGKMNAISLEDDIKVLEQFLCEKSETIRPTVENLATGMIKSRSPFAQKNNILKVDFERLDNLLNLMGELVIFRTRLGQIEARFKDSLGEKGLVLDLVDTTEQIGKVTAELHEAIMKVRMLPIKQVFMRFPRFVRDLAREKGKEINILFEGEEVELDKTVIDEIGEPLLHLVRNAVDHGIEGPQEREAQGKPRQGTIFIRAFQESSHIVIEVEDDGRGIDEKRLREKAEQAGLLEKFEGRNLNELIFVSGISTADEITEVSGRGLGMDVVRKSLAKINGNIEVESEPHVGTRFTIKLPLTLAIISALMVEVSGEKYAIPLASVVESTRLIEANIHLVNNREIVFVRDKIIPLARLSNLFGLTSSKNRKNSYVVIVQGAIGQIGIVVDALLGQQQIVIKALDDYVGNSVGIAGATILGDGKVVLIVDVLELIEKYKIQGTQIEYAEAKYA